MAGHHHLNRGYGKAATTLEKLIFGHRAIIIVLFSVLTVSLVTVAVRGLHIDASFTKQLPLKHEYMQTFVKHQGEFGSANRVLIALIARDGDMFQPAFFEALKKATDEVLVMDGIDRGRVQSLFTPNVRYMEVVEDGIEAGNVVDSEFEPTPEALARVRENILKAGIRGRLVANDFSGALISAIVLEQDATGRPIDPIEVARELETRVRDRIQDKSVLVQAQGGGVDVHMLVVVRDRIAKLVKSGKTQEQVVAARPTREFEEQYGGASFDAGQWLGRAYVDQKRALEMRRGK